MLKNTRRKANEKAKFAGKNSGISSVVKYRMW
jgi:hypothetical protein